MKQQPERQRGLDREIRVTSQPGSAGKSEARSRKKPNALAARAAEDSGLSNFPVPISLPGAASGFPLGALAANDRGFLEWVLR